MTCIVGIGTKQKAYIGADSAAIAGGSYDKRIRADPKVFFVENNDVRLIIGFTTSFRMGQLLRYKLRLPQHLSYMDDYQYMCTDFLDSVRETLKIGGFVTLVNHTESGGQFLVGYKGVVYTIHDDFQVGISDPNWDALGCGSNYAMGSLFSSQVQPPEDRIKLALEAASFYNAGVSPPFTILSL